MNIIEMRKKIMEAYDSKQWKERAARMDDRQVQAVYFRLVNETGRIKP